MVDRIHFLPQRAVDALTNHGLRDVVRTTLSLVDQQSEVTQQQRAGSSGTVSDEFRKLLEQAVGIGWGVPLAAASTAERPSPELDALSHLVYVDGQSGTKYPEHLLLLACAMHSARGQPPSPINNHKQSVTAPPLLVPRIVARVASQPLHGGTTPKAVPHP